MAAHNNSYSLPSQPLPLSPISMVDVFFPGLTNIPAALQQLQAGPNSYGRVLCICGLAVFFGRYTKDFFRALVATHFTSRVYVSHTNEAHDMLVAWLSSQPFSHKARSLLASVDARRRGSADDHSDENQKKPLQYSPWNGSFSFWYKNRLLTFSSIQKEGRVFREEEISVSCIGRSPDVLRELFSECRAEYLKLVKNKTSVFEHRDRSWKKTRAINKRPLDTVILDEQKKKALVEDIKAYLDPETQGWYSRRGIPYRKGYLLYGPPGTGKSSLSLSIAGACDLDIYILNLSSEDDSSLGKLFTELPKHCVVLVEDIDAVDATQSRQHGTVKTGQDETGSSTMGKSQRRVSLSALLNVLDGVGSQEGRVLIMTTNHAERLDAALIRPGRVDMKLELGCTNQDINARLFCAMFMHDDTLPDGSQRADEDTLRKLMTEFASKIPKQEFSAAEVQSFLMQYKRSPHMAVENAQEWVVSTREAKRQMRRADSWVLPEGGGILD
ncbi:P-loop containing nucleoside triphosphate hydrolase protein [Cadophora sp. DSE1049]|nr:P-loop containing nucleoside triphosphate hydrolase protein [Cadophora sp. DSE1049]